MYYCTLLYLTISISSSIECCSTMLHRRGKFHFPNVKCRVYKPEKKDRDSQFKCLSSQKATITQLRLKKGSTVYKLSNILFLAFAFNLHCIQGDGPKITFSGSATLLLNNRLSSKDIEHLNNLQQH